MFTGGETTVAAGEGCAHMPVATVVETMRAQLEVLAGRHSANVPFDSGHDASFKGSFPFPHTVRFTARHCPCVGPPYADAVRQQPAAFAHAVPFTVVSGPTVDSFDARYKTTLLHTGSHV